ncbi:MAG: GNAT family N-acetyltransferase [Pelagimonas sp.]|jgi:ribosomal-protein-alanine N-acetyltransferase|nr:GNAT family N-acetyltransferase [Pelagimonas sp.]
MTPEQLADISARAYQHMRPWSQADFRSALARPIHLLTHTEHAFVLGQVIADEAEITALAADPAVQRRGQASHALAQFIAAAHTRGARRIFLEVASRNAPARGFYAARGFRQVGRRRAYYSLADGATDDALVLCLDLTQANEKEIS